MAVMVGVAGAEEIVASGPDDIRRQRVEAEIASALVVAWERELMNAGESARRVFLFRNAVADVRRWFDLPQVRAAAEDGNIWRRLVTSEARRQAVAAILDACVPAAGMAEGMTAIFEHPDLRSTHGIQYQTSLGDHYPDSLDASTERSEINLAACHSGLEVEIARLLDAHPDVTAWARNYGLGWTLPYLYDGAWRRYEPDFVARLFGGRETGNAVYPDDRGQGPARRRVGRKRALRRGLLDSGGAQQRQARSHRSGAGRSRRFPCPTRPMRQTPPCWRSTSTPRSTAVGSYCRPSKESASHAVTPQ